MSRNPLLNQEINPLTTRDKIITIQDKNLYRKNIAALYEAKIKKISLNSISLDRVKFMETLANHRDKQAQEQITFDLNLPSQPIRSQKLLEALTTRAKSYLHH